MEVQDQHVGLVLPQSVIASRDAGPVRVHVAERARLAWSWWSPTKHFDADVLVCALGFELGPAAPIDWTRPVLDVLGIPDADPRHVAGTFGDRVRATANFRDESSRKRPPTRSRRIARRSARVSSASASPSGESFTP